MVATVLEREACVRKCTARSSHASAALITDDHRWKSISAEMRMGIIIILIILQDLQYSTLDTDAADLSFSGSASAHLVQ